jgi:hypothetical protein
MVRVTLAAVLAAAAAAALEPHPSAGAALTAPGELHTSVGADGSPRCTIAYNPAFETPCFTIVDKAGPVVIREYSSGPAPRFPQDIVFAGCTTREAVSFEEALAECGSSVLSYFLGANALGRPLNRTTPLLFQLPDGSTDDADGYRVKMALPPSAFNRSSAPLPANATGSVTLELLADGGAADAAYTVAAALFTTAGLPTEDDFATMCGNLDQRLPAGWTFDPNIGDGEWSQMYATFSTRDAPLHYNECWLAVSRSGQAA